MKSYRYLHYDVFTDRRFSGNQLAVFPEAVGLDAATMQRIALEMAFSETTFVFPATHNGVDVNVRIFTPRLELPMAGHPTVGTAFALAREGRLTPGAPKAVFGLGIGPTTVELDWESSELQFAWMVQPLPDFGREIAASESLAAALGLRASDLEAAGLPIQVVSSGVPLLFVPLPSRELVDTVVLDYPALLRCYDTVGLNDLAVFVFTRDGDDATVFSRMFAPAAGIPEDPATGGASGPLGAYLVRHAAVPTSEAQHIVSLQGQKMGRPSRIHIAIETRDGSITRVRVGGQAVRVGEGVVFVDPI